MWYMDIHTDKTFIHINIWGKSLSSQGFCHCLAVIRGSHSFPRLPSLVFTLGRLLGSPALSGTFLRSMWVSTLPTVWFLPDPCAMQGISLFYCINTSHVVCVLYTGPPMPAVGAPVSSMCAAETSLFKTAFPVDFEYSSLVSPLLQQAPACSLTTVPGMSWNIPFSRQDFTTLPRLIKILGSNYPPASAS